MTSSVRFSKQAVINYCTRNIDRLKAQGLDPDNGTAQVRGASLEKILAYGEFRLYLDLLFEVLDGTVVDNGRFSKDAVELWQRKRAKGFLGDHGFSSDLSDIQIEGKGEDLQNAYAGWRAANRTYLWTWTEV
ncbi:hypothetical protein RYA05_03110 [Pseudomonas syringae pv. actinidiae]|nr:hypothetical protein [Pseudomonas syringae pv. actinidiae]